MSSIRTVPNGPNATEAVKTTVEKDRTKLRKLLAAQYGFSKSVIYRNNLLDVSPDVRAVMIGQILANRASIQSKTHAKKRRGSLLPPYSWGQQ